MTTTQSYTAGRQARREGYMRERNPHSAIVGFSRSGIPIFSDAKKRDDWNRGWCDEQDSLIPRILKGIKPNVITPPKRTFGKRKSNLVED